jgi:hypothetical protein
MATTTNYGWTTPDDTALVKDGASAIRTLGSSVDTTTKNLNPETTLGDIAYRSSTANVKTRLGIGSAGQVLTVAAGVPSWATPSSSAGLTLITTQTFSAVASQSINNCFSATYRNYRIVITGKNDTSTNVVRLRARASGTDNTSSNYVSAGFEVTPNGGSGAIGCSTGTTFWHFGEMYTRTGLFIIDIANPFATEYTAFTALNAGNDATAGNCFIEFRGGNLTVTTSYDGFTIFPDANTITGRLEVYGYNQ